MWPCLDQICYASFFWIILKRAIEKLPQFMFDNHTSFAWVRIRNASSHVKRLCFLWGWFTFIMEFVEGLSLLKLLWGGVQFCFSSHAGRRFAVFGMGVQICVSSHMAGTWMKWGWFLNFGNIWFCTSWELWSMMKGSWSLGLIQWVWAYPRCSLEFWT